MPSAELEEKADNPLGKGNHAQAALVTAIALVTSSLHRLIINEKGRYLARGWDWEGIPGTNKCRWLAHVLFKVALSTIQRAVERTKKKAPQPKKRGPKVTSDPITLWPTLYAVIAAYVAKQRKNGDIVNIHKLAVYLQDECGDEELTFTYVMCRYWLKKFGFSYGHIHRKVSDARNKKYILEWLLAYCKRRKRYAENPTAADRNKILLFIDEAALRRDHTGNYSWFPPEKGGRIWGKCVGSSIRWGVVACILTWWEQATTEDQEKPPRKRRKKDAPQDPSVPGWVRKFACPDETLYAWNCTVSKTITIENGNMRTDKFLKYLRTVLEYVRKTYPSRQIELHIDNAKYHKQNTEYSQNLNSLSKTALKGWIMEFAPPEEGFDCKEAFEDGDGLDLTKAQLLDLALQFQVDPLNKVQELVAEFGGKVEYTAPYWSMAMPVEDYFNNMKFDYGACWDAIHRDKNVGKAVKEFNKSVPLEHVEGWCRHTDEFCIRVDAKDKATFDLGSYEALVEHGLA